MDIAQKKDIIVFILIIVLAFFIGYNGLYKYYLGRIDDAKRQIEEEKKKNDISGIIGILDRKMQAYQKKVFPTTEITQLLDKVSELAKEAGIGIETFNPLPAAYKDQYVELSLTVPIRCEYHQLGEFLSLIESSEKFIWVKELIMKKSTVTSRQEAVTPKIDLTISGIHLKK
ncbi:MAG: type 4a pilus biogenesis protein PilO [Candidatus Omnitrophica bacterium]|nr:type 4a pilus biogenesis protein PilO [Candidatus Omnitrophota bacterium]